jgi:hypothetical protein
MTVVVTVGGGVVVRLSVLSDHRVGGMRVVAFGHRANPTLGS